MDSLFVVGGQIAFVIVVFLIHPWRVAAATRALAAVSVALVLPAVATAWLLFLGVPVGVCRWVCGAALFTTAALLLRGSLPTLRTEGPAQVRWALALPFALPFLVQFAGAALKPESSVDGLLYHGAALANIVHEGSLFGWSSVNQYVFYSDLQMALNALWLDATSVVSLEDAVQAPYVSVAALAMYVLSSQTARYQLTRAWLCSAAVVAPVIWTQARVLYVDVAAGALLCAGIALAGSGWRSRDRAAGVVAALALGGAVATKPSSLFAGAVCIAAGAILVGLVGRVRSLVWYALTAAVAAAPFYLRNLVSFGNPFYPIGISFGPLKFEGVVDSEVFYSSGGQAAGLADPSRLRDFADSIWFGVLNGPQRWLYDPREGGFGRTPLLVVGTVALLLAVAALLGRRRSAGAGWAGRPDAVVLVAVVTALVVVVFTPNASDARYVIPSVLLLTGALLALVSLAPRLPGVDQVVAVAVAAAAAVGIVRSEAIMLFGIAESVRLQREDPDYNTGIDGDAISYGDSFAWLRGTTCPTIVAQTQGGLTPLGMPGDGLMTTYQYGLWGDELCNDVHFLPTPDEASVDAALADPSTGELVADADFVVIDARFRSRWEQLLSDLGLGSSVVYAIPSTDQFPVEQVVLRLQRGTAPAG